MVSPAAVDPRRTSPTIGAFRLYAALVFSFAWVPVMYTAFTRDRGFSPDQYLEMWSVYYFTMVLAELPWGHLADRLGQRPLLIAGPLLLAVGFAVLGHSSSYAACLGAMALTGAAHAMIDGADSAYLYEVVLAEGRAPSALREEAIAHRWRLFGVSLCDVAGGFVAALAGTAAAFDLSIALALGAAAVAWRLPAVSPSRVRNAWSLRGVGRSLGTSGVAWVLVWYSVVFVMLRIGFQLYQPTLLAVGVDDLRLHGGLLGVLNLAAALAAFFVARIHRRMRERGTAGFVLLLLAASFAGLALLDPWMLTPLLCLQQVSYAFLQPVGRTALNQRITSTNRTAALSAQSVLARLGFGAVLALGSWDAALGDGLGATYGGLALLSVGAAALLTLFHPGDNPSRRGDPQFRQGDPLLHQGDEPDIRGPGSSPVGS